MTAARIIISLITSIGIAIGAIWFIQKNQQEVPITVFSNRRRQNRHDECSNPPSTVRHPLLNRCVFEFRDSGGDDDKLCVACGVGTSSCYYECMGHCDKVIHLDCSKLPQTMNVGEIRLVLNNSMTSECSNCYPGLRTSDGRTWGYKSQNNLQLHIYCVKQSFPKLSSDPDQQRNIIRSINVSIDGAEELIAMTKAIGSVLT